MSRGETPAKLLLVDDNPDNLLVLEKVIDHYLPRCTVVTAGRAEEGLSIAATLSLDGVLIDLQMPGMDGIEMCRRLKAAPLTAEVPVILLTSSLSSPEKRVEGLEAGANDFIVRPISNLELAARIKTILRLKQAEDRLRESNARYVRRLREKTVALRNYRKAVESSEDLIVAFDRDHRLLLANRAFFDYCGLQRASAQGRTIDEILGGELRENRIVPLLNRCFGGEAATQELSLLLPGGGLRDMYVRYTPLKSAGGSIEGALVTLRDVTEIRRAEAESRRNGQLASLGELAAGVAHEINNPINGVINYAQLLANRLGGYGPGADIANRIIKEGDRIAVIVRNLLSFARQRKEHKGPVSITEVLDESLALVRAQLARDGIRLSVELDAALPRVRGLKQQLQQVVLNLISNARYALNNPRGESREKVLEIRGERLAGQGASHIRLTFFDNGRGIAAQHLEKVLNPFFTTKPQDQGTGLGLSISHGIVNDHRGQLGIESVEGQFTRVTVQLPADLPPEGRP